MGLVENRLSEGRTGKTFQMRNAFSSRTVCRVGMLFRFAAVWGLSTGLFRGLFEMLPAGV